MDIKITPRQLKGEVAAISSKSFAHRIIIAAALSDEDTKINLNASSQDIDATIECIKALGSTVTKGDGYITVSPIDKKSVSDIVLDCNESGSTARFLLPVASVLYDSFKMTGRGRLPERPFSPLLSQMELHGIAYDKDTLPFNIKGRLTAGKYEISGNISSQYITGLMFALSLCDKNSEIVLTSPLESSAYVDITISVLSLFGVKIEKTKTGFLVYASKYTSPKEITVEGDWSNGAFWICANHICKNVSITGLDNNSLQGDRAILTELGKDIIDAKEIPDLVPILSVAACAKNGKTQIINAQRLRLKESDRLMAVCTTLSALGADISETDDGLIINGNGKLSGGVCQSFGDHRIVMSCAIASCLCTDSVTITGAEAVNKSYPAFFDDFASLGGKIEII